MKDVRARPVRLSACVTSAPLLAAMEDSTQNVKIEHADPVALARVRAVSQMPERIVLCIDVSDEMDSPWPLQGTQAYNRLKVLQQTLQQFVQLKAYFDSRHSFAVCALADSAEWLLDFTTDVDMVCTVLAGLHVQQGCDPAFDFQSLFKLMQVKSSAYFSNMCTIV
jgi:hypothetical protein